MGYMSALDGKTVLVTGGTGSFGKCFIRKALTESDVAKIIVFSRDELKQWEMRQSDPVYDHERIRYFLGDVRDRDRLYRAFNGVDLVVHAAALKQVPAAEYNPTEFIKTNVHGAMNVIDAALDRDIEKVIALSTDKAANPINLYGATKLCSDKLFVAANSYTGEQGRPRFAVVRYGNVLGSRGSIVPRWRQMVADGATSLPVTDERMTRFWITLPMAADFVARNFVRMMGGEVFVPKIPSMRITELAAAIAPELPIEHIGIRPGEKLHELMIGEDDARHAVELEDAYAICPQTCLGHSMASVRSYLELHGARPVEDGWEYRSETNSQWMDAAELRELIDGPVLSRYIA